MRCVCGVCVECVRGVCVWCGVCGMCVECVRGVVCVECVRDVCGVCEGCGVWGELKGLGVELACKLTEHTPHTTPRYAYRNALRSDSELFGCSFSSFRGP